MNHPEDFTRRLFLQSTGAITGSAYLRILAPGIAAISQAACSARDQGMAFETLGPSEARDFAAIAARILPTTDTPGATEAGVIHFIDRAFGAEMGEQLFSMPKYGGNRDKVGWELIGFEGDHGPWTYPFGYYDAQVHGEKTDGE